MAARATGPPKPQGRDANVSIAQATNSKIDSNYPRTWNFKKDGVLPGRHQELRAIKAPDFNTGQLVDKVVWEAKDDRTGEIVSVFLSDTVLFNSFSRELSDRKRRGVTLKPGELITVTPLGLLQPKSSSGKPHNGYDVVFEHGVPPVTAEELLLGGTSGDEGSGNALAEATAEPPIGGQLGPDEDVPF